MKKAVIAVLQVLGSLVVFLALTITAKVTGFDWEAGDPRGAIFGESALTIVGIPLTTLVMVLTTRSKAPWSSAGRGRAIGERFRRRALFGLCVTSTMLALTGAGGGARIVFDSQTARAYPGYVFTLGVALLLASLAEEWFFRWYLLTRLAEVIGRGPNSWRPSPSRPRTSAPPASIT